MKILIRNSDSVVLFADDSLTIDTCVRWGSARYDGLNSTTAKIETATLPANWQGGIWSYANGAWAVADQAAYDKHVADILAKSQDEQAKIATAQRESAKASRATAVEAITVTTAAGNTFDGDETSQTRMTRAIIALQATNTPSVNWVLANNTAIQATAAELVEALALSGAAQAAVWVL